MKNKSNLFYLKVILNCIILSYLLIHFQKTSFFYITLVSNLFFILSLIANNYFEKQKKVFKISTQYGELKISEKVIRNIISIVLRKFKIVKHYECVVFNRKDNFIINLNIDTTLKNEDLLPEIIFIMKSNIIEQVNKLIGIAEIESVEVVIDKIKRL